MVVDGPGDDDSDGREEAAGRGIHTGVAPPDAGFLAARAGDGHCGIAYGCQERVEADEETSIAEAV